MKRNHRRDEDSAWLRYWMRRSPQLRNYYQTVRIPSIWFNGWKRVKAPQW